MATAFVSPGRGRPNLGSNLGTAAAGMAGGYGEAGMAGGNLGPYGDYGIPGAPGVPSQANQTPNAVPTAPQAPPSNLGTAFTTTPQQVAQGNDYSAWYQAYTNGSTQMPYEKWKSSGGLTAANQLPTNLGYNGGYTPAPTASFQQTTMPGFGNPITVPTLQSLVNNDVYSVTGSRNPTAIAAQGQQLGFNPATYDPRAGIVGDAQLYNSLYPATPEAQNPDTISQIVSQLFGTQQAPASLNDLMSHPASAQPNSGLLTSAPSVSNLGQTTTQNPVTLPTTPQYRQQDPLAQGTPQIEAPQSTQQPALPQGVSWDQIQSYINQMFGGQSQNNGGYTVGTSPLGTTYWQQPAAQQGQNNSLGIQDLLGLFALSGLFGNNSATRNSLWRF